MMGEITVSGATRSDDGFQ